MYVSFFLKIPLSIYHLTKLEAAILESISTSGGQQFMAF